MDSEHESRAEIDASVRLRAFGYCDIHPLWGGESMWVTNDLIAEVRFVDATQRKGHFRPTLSSDEWLSVERIVSESGLLTVEMPMRNGVPDEGRPSITLVLTSGETVVRAKWANDQVPAFDRVYEHLRALADCSARNR